MIVKTFALKESEWVVRGIRIPQNTTEGCTALKRML